MHRLREVCGDNPTTHMLLCNAGLRWLNSTVMCSGRLVEPASMKIVSGVG